MHRYFIKCAYDGSHYSGWQIQTNAVSVQGAIQDALSTVLRNKIDIVGCGRTDAGVHASGYYFHFDYEGDFDDKHLFSANRVLAKSIQLISFQKVSADDHARYSATARQYRYQIALTEDPFKLMYHHRLNRPELYDQKALENAASLFIGKYDFEFFSKVGSDVNHYNCEVYKSEWLFEKDEWFFRVQANRFMRGMVRLLVGAQLQLASGKITDADMRQALSKTKSLDYNFSVPGNALFLEKIDYDFISG